MRLAREGAGACRLPLGGGKAARELVEQRRRRQQIQQGMESCVACHETSADQAVVRAHPGPINLL
jgi:hypothetical protein